MTARRACLHVSGEIAAALGNAAPLDAEPLAAAYIKAATTAPAASGSSGGASHSLGGAGASEGGAAAVRAAAVAALARLIAGVGPRAGPKCLAAALRHVTASASSDRAHTVRLAVGPALQVRAVAWARRDRVGGV